MAPHEKATHFDSPERTPEGILERRAFDVGHAPLVAEMLEAFPTAALVLDSNRQIVAINSRALAAFDVMSPHDVQGLRIGEALGCICASDRPAGCGTTPHCAECGAAHAVREARDGHQVVRECRITTAHDGKERSFEFRVVATPMRVAGHSVRLVALEDIAAEKRREALERIFFHDVLGTANAVHGLARVILNTNGGPKQQAAESLVRATGQLMDEIQAQRDLLLAERGELMTLEDAVRMNDVIETVHQQYRCSSLADGRDLVLRRALDDRALRTDRTQLVRSLGNLVRNALEAVHDGERVTISAEPMADGGLFQVSNPGSIPPPLQLQIFQRSFSTKSARGRGIGTYSVKLIVEQYLKGRVSFVSSADTGTIFSIWIPSGTPIARADG